MKKTILTAKYLIASALLLPAQTSAIIIRDDVPDGQYIQLAEAYAQSVVELAIPRRNGNTGPGNGLGTLVSPTWVLTAAHVAAGIRRLPSTHRVLVDGKPYAVAEVILHPEWRGEREGPDIALIRLAAPVEAARPACIFGGTDESGKIVTLVGSGDSGTGLTGPRQGPIKLRAATSTVGPVAADEPVLSWTFRAPTDPAATPLEGVSGPGDSGGPAFITVDQKICVAGVSVAQDGMGRGPGRYGAREFYTRVSSFKAWIDGVIGGRAS